MRTVVSVTSNEVHHPKPETQHHKFKAAHVIVLRMATVISEAGTKEFNTKMTQIKELLPYWENGTSVEVIRKECTSNDGEVSGDSEIIDDLMRDDDDRMSDDHFDNGNDADVSRMAIETQDEMDKSTSEGIVSWSGEEPSCLDWSEVWQREDRKLLMMMMNIMMLLN